MATPDELGDITDLRLWPDHNGTRRQDGTTADIIFSPAHLIRLSASSWSWRSGI
ncbi:MULTISPECIES: fumarylacetoacetate hydrolase family protein [unclassified Streptomyces]|uniref:fumarylacetoacetate hydrolase family protein n=1 Tax=unclassified Streptomyces TaxID=2593676 RepID=UPI00333249E8